MNPWGTPAWLEEEVRQRDRACVYCGIEMTLFSGQGSRGAMESWEHIINDAGIITRENITLCCISCNSSKGSKLLSEWLESPYCTKRGITANSVAPVIRLALELNTALKGIDSTSDDTRQF